MLQNKQGFNCRGRIAVCAHMDTSGLNGDLKGMHLTISTSNSQFAGAGMKDDGKQRER